MNQYNVWNKWGKLKTVMLGDCYTEDFFNDVKNPKIRSALQQIANETQEDLEFYSKTLKDFGCNVIRPKLQPYDTIMNYLSPNGKVKGNQGVPRAPLQPRDMQLVIGNTLYYTGQDHRSIFDSLNNYNSTDVVNWPNYRHTIPDDLRPISEEIFNTIAGTSWGSWQDYKTDLNYFNKLPDDIYAEIKNYESITFFQQHIAAPSMTLIGRDLYIDCFDQKFYQYQTDSIIEKIPNIRINTLHHGGHSDGCFHTIKPGAILSLEEIQTYENTFPDWDVCYLPNQSWGAVDGFMKLKNQVKGKWWVPGEEDNHEFTHFVETWLQDWVGYVEETVFDVNVLVLDEHHVCVNNMNPTVIEFLRKHKMEPVHIPWRHRYFWDGGLHCITLDLEREGTQEDYFPDRSDQGIIDYGFD